MSSEEPPQQDEVAGDSATARRPPWQFSIRSLLLFTAAVALLLSIWRTFPEQAVWPVITLGTLPAAMVAHWLPSKIIRLLTLLMLFQFVGAALMAPGDGGVWFCRMCRLYFGVDVFLFVRLFLFYAVARWPEPQLSWLTKVAIMTSPIWTAVIATYLMETYGVFC